ADVQKQFSRFEQAEWLYDGMSGKVIAWTKEHGGTSDDPAVQAFVVAPDSGQVARVPTEQAYAPSDFAKWLKEQADTFEKTHPATRMAFQLAEIKVASEGTARTWTCA